MKTSDNDNHKAGKQHDARKVKQDNNKVTTTGYNKNIDTNKPETHYNSPHAF